MSVAIVTGASGLIGSETVEFLHRQGLDVVGIDNNMRQYFFGDDGSTDWNAERLQKQLPGYRQWWAALDRAPVVRRTVRVALTSLGGQRGRR